MIREDPLHLVGGHTAPMLGNAVEVLTNYRDAMQWVLDRTIEGAKQYMTPDELVDYAALPEHLAELDYLADALDIIGERTFNAPARNYTLSSANRYRQQASGND